ncbi:hypothetical protein QMZ05_08035 [Bradyrhizobium sp. INPA03-11B]|uniref:hypothetical protein n=1 Tax=Bradyrhizobium sp. INPA03-11B TaxID=418598 RepID=UPI00338FE690
MHEETWWEGPLCVTHPINGRRIFGICHDDQWRWTVRINGPAWQDTHLHVMAYAGATVEQARDFATKLGPVREQDESEIADELHRQLEAARNSS